MASEGEGQEPPHAKFSGIEASRSQAAGSLGLGIGCNAWFGGCRRTDGLWIEVDRDRPHAVGSLRADRATAAADSIRPTAPAGPAASQPSLGAAMLAHGDQGIRANRVAAGEIHRQAVVPARQVTRRHAPVATLRHERRQTPRPKCRRILESTERPGERGTARLANELGHRGRTSRHRRRSILLPHGQANGTCLRPSPKRPRT